MKSISAMDDVNFPYGIRLTYTPATFAKLPESIAFLCENTKCKTMQVEPSFAAGRGDYADPTPDQASAFTEAFMEAFEIASSSGRTLFYSGARPWIVASAFCKAPEDSLVVTPEGDVVACFETHDRRHPLTTQFVLGRISQEGLSMDEQSLFSFAQNQEWRRRDCEGCFCYWHCCGDCATKTASLPQENRGRCLANRAITRELLAWYIAAGNGLWSSRSGNMVMS
jgi:radical SAM protein with 4Fe4S-binding SPASM domain